MATCELASDRHGIDSQEMAQTALKRSREQWQSCPVFQFCSSTGIASWSGLSAAFDAEGRHFEALRGWIPEYRRRSWELALADHGVTDDVLVERLAAQFPVERQRRVVAFPEAHQVLDELGHNFRLAMLTNGVPDMQHSKIDRARLRTYFDVIVVAGEIGVGKPQAKAFEVVLDRLRIGPDESVMVGDNLERDVAGAQAIGIRAIWVNRVEARELAGKVQPDGQIKDLSELMPLVNNGN